PFRSSRISIATKKLETFRQQAAVNLAVLVLRKRFKLQPQGGQHISGEQPPESLAYFGRGDVIHSGESAADAGALEAVGRDRHHRALAEVVQSVERCLDLS